MSDGKLLEQFFDFEVYPEWWCCVVGQYPQDDVNPESRKNDFTVISSDDNLANDKLVQLLADKSKVNVGYNIKKYDNIILNAVASELTPRQIYIVSDIIVSMQKNPDIVYKNKEYLSLASFAKRRYNNPNYIYQDLLDDNTGSLKEKEACMQLDIRECDVDFDKVDLSWKEKAEIISYCKHDVWSTMEFYRIVVKPFVMTKLLVGKVFNIPVPVCYKSTNAQLSAIALDAKFTKFQDSDRIDIEIPDGLKQYINYSLPSTVIKRVCSSPSAFDVELFGNEVSYANGGIHSVPIRPANVSKKSACTIIAESNDEWALVNADAASFYPATMINWNTLSRAVSKPEKFAEMYHQRLDFKKVIEPFENKYGRDTHLATKEEKEHYQYCKDTSQAYKLILNTTFGASGNKYLALNDPYMTTKTCRLGQLLLTSLANNLYNQIGKNNIIILQTNTDGVLCYLRRTYLEMFEQICDKFTDVSHIMIEIEHEQKIWQRDVNNYIMLKSNGRIKSKGGFFVTDMIQPGYNRVRPLNCYVARDAMKEYLLHGTDPVKYILSERDISKFVLTYSKGTASRIYRTYNDGRLPEELHRCNRVYASTDKRLGIVKLVYTRLGKETHKTAPDCPEHCHFVNKALKNYDATTLTDLDYLWYINKTYSMLLDSNVWFEIVDGNFKKIDEIIKIE